MITFHVDQAARSLIELQTLLPEHWKELALEQDKVPLEPQWHVYLEREARGELLYVTARDAGDLVGYFVGFIAPALHYASCLTCTMDIFYIRRDKRNGTAGVRLFRFVEAELRRRGVKRWFAGSKVHADASALFERLQFKRVEIYYSKWLGD